MGLFSKSKDDFEIKGIIYFSFVPGTDRVNSKKKLKKLLDNFSSLIPTELASASASCLYLKYASCCNISVVYTDHSAEVAEELQKKGVIEIIGVGTRNFHISSISKKPIMF